MINPEMNNPNPTNRQETPQLEYKVNEVLTRGVVEVINADHLRQRMLSGEELRIKFGIDPTGSDIHIGRASTIRKLRQFQDLGHKIVFIIGDFTAQIGDTSDKTEGRRMLSEDEITSNEKNYLDQIGKILDISKTEVHHNSEWINSLKPADLVKLASNFSIQQMVARENFSDRIQRNVPVGVHELLYPIVQGFDSVMVRADLELGGTDQLFNLMAGRKLQEISGQKPQDIMIMQLLAGTDGRKMSTSWGNVITIIASPEEKFGKIMSLSDQLISVYMEMATNIPMERVREVQEMIENQTVNPISLKKELAFRIVELFDGKQSAIAAQENFERVVQRRELPSEDKIPVAIINGNSIKINDLLSLINRYNLTKSKGEAKRLLEQNGITSQEGSSLKDMSSINIPKDGLTIKVGKRRFLRITPDNQ